MIEIKISNVCKGEFNRGIFATRDIRKGELIHEAPAVTFLNEEYELIEKTTLADFVFNYGANHTAILLGYGSLFNHSYTPNAVYELQFEKLTADFFAHKDIKAGEEIFINYNGEVDCMDPLWFMEEAEEEEEPS